MNRRRVLEKVASDLTKEALGWDTVGRFTGQKALNWLGSKLLGKGVQAAATKGVQAAATKAVTPAVTAAVPSVAAAAAPKVPGAAAAGIRKAVSTGAQAAMEGAGRVMSAAGTKMKKSFVQGLTMKPQGLRGLKGYKAARKAGQTREVAGAAARRRHMTGVIGTNAAWNVALPGAFGASEIAGGSTSRLGRIMQQAP